MLDWLIYGLLSGGALILVGALFPLCRLVAELPPGKTLVQWCVLMALVGLFIAGYIGYAVAFRVSFASTRAASAADAIVPVVFFLGALFVLLTCSLALQTARELRRLPVLERETATDPLTGIFNRRYLERRLDEEVARARRHALPLGILVVDVDHFKAINDRYGHPAGDRVLVEVARAIGETVRSSDVAARYGGEEFVIIAPGAAPQTAAALGERLRARIEASEIVATPDDAHSAERIRVTASIGVAVLEPRHEDARSLLAEADQALYRAKALGRNGVVGPPPAGQE